MGVKRIKPNILSERFDESRAFYNDVIGLEGGDGLDWILFFGTDQPEVQLSVMKVDIKAHVHPDVSIEGTMLTPCANALAPLGLRSSTHSRTKSGACAGFSCAIRTAP